MPPLKSKERLHELPRRLIELSSAPLLGVVASIERCKESAHGDSVSIVPEVFRAQTVADASAVLAEASIRVDVIVASLVLAGSLAVDIGQKRGAERRRGELLEVESLHGTSFR